MAFFQKRFHEKVAQCDDFEREVDNKKTRIRYLESKVRFFLNWKFIFFSILLRSTIIKTSIASIKIERWPSKSKCNFISKFTRFNIKFFF